MHDAATVSENDSLVGAANMIVRKKLHRLIVVDDHGALLGVVSKRRHHARHHQQCALCHGTGGGAEVSRRPGRKPTVIGAHRNHCGVTCSGHSWVTNEDRFCEVSALMCMHGKTLIAALLLPRDSRLYMMTVRYSIYSCQSWHTSVGSCKGDVCMSVWAC